MKFPFVSCLVLCAFLTSDSFAFERKKSDVLSQPYKRWLKNQDRPSLVQFLEKLYDAYLTDSENPTTRKFYQHIRLMNPEAISVLNLRDEILKKYRAQDAFYSETPSLQRMPLFDARMLFLTMQVKPDSADDLATRAMFKSIYFDIERSFCLNFALKGQLGIFERSEYLRLLEILKRNSVHPDPYLQALNHYYRAILYLNLDESESVDAELTQTRNLLNNCLQKVETKISRKTALILFARTYVLQRDYEKAKSAYVSILKIDPQDWEALFGLSALLRESGQCADASVWIEATAKAEQELFDVVVHCGSREFPEDEFQQQGRPLIAFLQIR